MIVAITIAYAACGVASFFLFKRVCVSMFGRFTRDDLVIAALLSIGGPFTVFWVLLIMVMVGGRRSDFWSKPFRSTKHKDKP